MLVCVCLLVCSRACVLLQTSLSDLSALNWVGLHAMGWRVGGQAVGGIKGQSANRCKAAVPPVTRGPPDDPMARTKASTSESA